MTFELIKNFENALQLSVPVPLDYVVYDQDRWYMEIIFQKDVQDNSAAQNFAKILGFKKNVADNPSCWWEQPWKLVWQEAAYPSVVLISELLMLTRLKNENLLALAKVDSRFKPWVDRLGLKSGTTKNLQKPGEQVFAKLLQKKLTQTELAKKANLSLVTLHKFKKGGDIRLSNFLNLLNALNLEMILKEKK